MGADTATPEADAAPWVYGDRVGVSGYDIKSSRRRWNDRRAVLHKRAKQDGWTVRLEDKQGKPWMEVDMPRKHLTMVRRRGWLSGDQVTAGGSEMQLLVGPFTPEEETTPDHGPHWTARLDTGEEIQVAENKL